MNGNIVRTPFRYAWWNVTLVLVLANVLLFALRMLVPHSVYYLSLSVPGIGAGFVWQFATYMFMHGDIAHLLFNMFALYVFGEPVERQMGSKEFLLFYFAVGTLAGVASWLSYLATGMHGAILLGASGAVYGVMLAFAVVFPMARVLVLGLVPVPAPVLILVYTGWELVSELARISPNVAHLTHLAGYGFALAYFPVRFGINPLKRLARRR